MGEGLPGDVGGCLIDDSLDAALAEVAGFHSVLVASDYDGTLAPIVDDPRDAVPDSDAIGAFLRVAGHPRTHAVVISGRSEEVLEGFFGHHDEVTLVGNHGASVTTSAESERVGNLTRALTDLARSFPGAEVEAKRTGTAFHYRHAQDPKGAATAATQIAASHEATVINGKMVIEAVVGTGDKGTAINTLRDRLEVDAVIFIGDDTTDEAAFGVLRSPDIGIKVGTGHTAATFRVNDVSDVAHVFTRLADCLRERDSGSQISDPT